jgi:multidrug efflux pump subunit AcrA (membrane-fusion protein)
VVLLAGCSVFNPATPTPLPTRVLDSGSAAPQPAVPDSRGGVVASGVVAPAQTADLVFTLSGAVEAVEIVVGQAVTAAQAALNRLTLTAPFAGTVASLSLHPGEWVIPGQRVLTLADLANLRVETTDLSERDIPQVEVGQPVTVFIKALGEQVPGRVSDISPLADSLGGDVVYKTTIELDELPPGLRAGMSVEVEFGTEP